MKLTQASSVSILQSIILSFLILIPLSTGARVTKPNRVPKNAVLLSKVNTLTLRAGKSTSHRRVSSVPQLQCVGPSRVCGLYDIDVMRCKNQGSDYEDENIQWTCSASLPEEFKLGSTEVTCEGYESSEDPYVLKGSCGVEYRLLLTEKGEEKFGQADKWDLGSGFRSKSLLEKGGQILFWLIFFGVIILIALSAMGCLPRGGPDRAGGPRAGGGGGGGGDDGWDDDPRGPPPPYDSTTPRKYKTSSNRQSNTQNAGWRPGFWSGALGGAAAGYLAGQRGRGGEQSQQPAAARGGFWGSNPNAGPSNSRPSAPSSPSYSSSRYESSGFGSTSRR